MGLRYKGGLDLARVRDEFGIKKALEVGKAGFEVSGFERKGDFLVPLDEGLMIADYASQKVIEILMKMC